MKSKILVCLLALCLTACATKYKPASDSFFGDKCGYKDYRMDHNKFSISFTANEASTRELVMNYALKRASELCIENGFTHFVVLSKKDAGVANVTVSDNIVSHHYYPGVIIHIEAYNNNIPEEALNASYYQNI